MKEIVCVEIQVHSCPENDVFSIEDIPLDAMVSTLTLFTAKDLPINPGRQSETKLSVR